MAICSHSLEICPSKIISSPYRIEALEVYKDQVYFKCHGRNSAGKQLDSFRMLDKSGKLNDYFLADYTGDLKIVNIEIQGKYMFVLYRKNYSSIRMVATDAIVIYDIKKATRNFFKTRLQKMIRCDTNTMALGNKVLFFLDTHAWEITVCSIRKARTTRISLAELIESKSIIDLRSSTLDNIILIELEDLVVRAIDVITNTVIWTCANGYRGQLKCYRGLAISINKDSGMTKVIDTTSGQRY